MYAANAALLAIQIIAVTDDELAKVFADKREAGAKKVLEKDKEISQRYAN